MELLVSGKVKDVYELDDDRLRFRFTDRISVFDKVIPSTIPGKGESICRTSAHWFEIAHQMNIDSHFISTTSKNEMDVKRVGQPMNLKMPEAERNGNMIPLEFICRHFIAGSLWDRLKKGKVSKEQLEITGEPESGQRLPEPFFELTTKFEEFDRPISFEEAITSFGVRKEELDEVREITLKMDEGIASEVENRGLLHADGKKEFAIGSEGQIMLIDTFGTADEDRFWDRKSYDDGRFIELSKEFVRQYYRGTGYHDSLTDARENGTSEPDVPALPQQMIEDTGKLYADLFERITGQEF